MIVVKMTVSLLFISIFLVSKRLNLVKAGLIKKSYQKYIILIINYYKGNDSH